jgi:hypothetical protein
MHSREVKIVKARSAKRKIKCKFIVLGLKIGILDFTFSNAVLPNL